MDVTTRTAVLEKVKADWDKHCTTVTEGRWVIGPDGCPRRQKEGDHNDVVKKEVGKGWVLVEKDGSSKMILVAESGKSFSHFYNSIRPQTILYINMRDRYQMSDSNWAIII